METKRWNLLLQQQSDVMLGGGWEHRVDLADGRFGLHRRGVGE